MMSPQRSPRRHAIPFGSAALAGGLLLCLAGSAMGQGSGPATRADLQMRLESLQQVIEKQPNSAAAEGARERIETIRTRLEHGDFQPGDVVNLTVWPDTSLTGSFQVNSQRALELPVIPDVDLSGVLYAEADSVIREHVGQYFKDPEITVQVTRRIAILGAVQQPGFYDLAPSTTLSDALMAAGGPTNNAKLEQVKLRREGETALKGQELSLQRMTLADLGPSEDDQLVVPQEGAGFGAMDALGVLSAVSGTAWAISRIF